MTQKKMILKHLQDYGSIEPLEALGDYGIYRLASRISELRDAGYKIKTEKVQKLNRFGKKIQFAKYVLQ